MIFKIVKHLLSLIIVLICILGFKNEHNIKNIEIVKKENFFVGYNKILKSGQVIHIDLKNQFKNILFHGYFLLTGLFVYKIIMWFSTLILATPFFLIAELIKYYKLYRFNLIYMHNGIFLSAPINGQIDSIDGFYLNESNNRKIIPPLIQKKTKLTIYLCKGMNQKIKEYCFLYKIQSKDFYAIFNSSGKFFPVYKYVLKNFNENMR